MGNQNSFESVSSYAQRSLKGNTNVKSSGESSKRRLVSQTSSQEATFHGSSCVYTNQTTKKLERKNKNNPIEKQPATERKWESAESSERSLHNRVREQPAKMKIESGKGPERLSKEDIEKQLAKMKMASGEWSERLSHKPVAKQPADRIRESGKLPERSLYNHIAEQPAKKKRESGKVPEILSHMPIKELPPKRKRESGKLQERLSSKPFKEQLAKGEGDCAKRPERLSFCQICMDKKTEANMFNSRNCSHSYCLVCTGKHVAAKLRENIIMVKCPDLACSGLLEPQDCRSVLPQQVLDRWEAALCESVLGSKKIYCPFRDCSAPLVDDGKQVVTSAECPHCHRLFCAQCKIPWHANSKCKPKGESMDKKFIELAKREKWQKCPRCKFYVQKTYGCESITCRCGYEFCYICGKGWSFGHSFMCTGRLIYQAITKQ